MSNLFSPTFFIGRFRVGSIEGASCLNMGNNLPTDFTNNTKHNQGFGNVSGDHNDISDLLSLLTDSDLVDMVNIDDDKDTPEWLKELMLKQMERLES